MLHANLLTKNGKSAFHFLLLQIQNIGASNTEKCFCSFPSKMTRISLRDLTYARVNFT